MDGLFRCLAPTGNVRLQGRTFRLYPMRLRDYAELELLLMIRRESPLDVVQQRADQLPAALHRRLLDIALDEVWMERRHRIVSMDEINRHLDSDEGLTWWAARKLWRKGKPAFRSQAAAGRFLVKCPTPELRELIRRREIVNATDVLANMEWPGGSDDGETRAIPWKRILKYLGQEYGWGPREAGMLTMWELKLYLSDEKELGGVQRMSPEAAVQMRRDRNPYRRRENAGTGPRMHAARRQVRARLAEKQRTRM